MPVYILFIFQMYYGVTFRAFTQSYRLKDGRYQRIDDNQISAFLDFYPAKRLCITLEPGYGIMRKLRSGTEHREYTQIRNFGDGPFIKLSTSYRLRF